MLMAEGLTRRLAPDHNMWVFTQPLIERWARENLGVEARLRETASGMLEAAARLPRLAARAEKALEALEEGVRLAPASVDALAGRRRRPSLLHALLALVAALLAALLALQVV